VQALVLGAKVRAMLNERYHVSFDDVGRTVLPSLRHRVLLNFEGQAEGIQPDDVLADVLKSTPRTVEQKLSA
jgi:MoxR-like ATPase